MRFRTLLPTLLLVGGTTPAVAAPRAHTAAVVLPEGFAGKERAIMAALFPQWTPDDETTGEVVSDRPQHARLFETKRLSADNKVRLAVLAETWAGDRCDESGCAPQPTVLGIFELREGKLSLLAPAAPAGHHGGGTESALQSEELRMAPDRSLVGVAETTRGAGGGETHGVLRLFLVDGGELKVVFERSIRDEVPAGPGHPAVDCDAVVSSDEFGSSPYPLRVTETCRNTGHSSKELWRWEAGQYKLHGPASNATVGDEIFKKSTDDPVK